MADTQTPPPGLFARIIRRLGLERQLSGLKRHAGAIAASLVVIAVFAAWALHILMQVLRWSNFGPFARLAFTNPDIMVHQRGAYVFSILESIPALEVALFCAALASVLALVRWLAGDVERYQRIMNRIHNQHDEHHQ